MEYKAPRRKLRKTLRAILPLLAIAGTLSLAHRPPVQRQTIYAPNAKKNPVDTVVGYDPKLFSSLELAAGKDHGTYKPNTAVKIWDDMGKYEERSREAEQLFVYDGDLHIDMRFPQKPADVIINGKSYADKITQSHIAATLEKVPVGFSQLEILVYYHEIPKQASHALTSTVPQASQPPSAPQFDTKPYQDAERYMIELEHLSDPHFVPGFGRMYDEPDEMAWPAFP